MSDVLDYIRDFPVGQDRIDIYVDVVKQVETIFELGSAFASGLAKAIKKDKSWKLALWSKAVVDELLSPLLRHLRADRIGRTRREGALKTINSKWGPEICGFFRSRKESEKTLRQLAHLASNCFLYQEARRLVNALVVEQLLSGTSQHSGRFNTSTADWTRVEFGQDAPEISFACFSAANVNYGPFGELLEGPPPRSQISYNSWSVIVTHYGQYGKLLEGPEDKPMVDVDEIAVDAGEDDTSEDDDNEAANGNGEDGGDQDNDRVADVTVGLPAIVEHVVDSEDGVNDEQGLDACILAEVITHPFGTSSSGSKAPGSVGSHSPDVLSSSLGAPLPGLPAPCSSAFLGSSGFPLPSCFLPAVSSDAPLSSGVLLPGPGCCSLPGVSFGAPPSADAPSLSAFLGSSSPPSSLDLLSTVANHPGKIFKILH